MTKTIDLNCDMGESFGAWTMGQDDAVLVHVSSANIACGFHAGDPATMRRRSMQPLRAALRSARIHLCRISQVSGGARCA